MTEERKSYYQYRFIVNGTTGDITEKYNGEKWTHICDVAEEHGFDAFFERRSVIPGIEHMKQLLGDYDDGWIYLDGDDLAVSPWQSIAHALYRGS